MPPQSGISPILTKLWMKLADFAASAMSPASAKFAPAPAATPLTATTIGFGHARILRISGLNRVSMLWPTSTRSALPGAVRALREILAGAEAAPRAGDDDDAAGRVGLGRGESGGEPRRHVAG